MSLSTSQDSIEAGSSTTQNTKSITTRKSQGTKDLQVDDGQSFEVFRSNTTAVEISVKQVSKASEPLKNHSPRKFAQSKREEGNEEIQNEVIRIQAKLDETRKGFTSLLLQMKTQLDASIDRGSATASQVEILALRLENARLTTLLESKTALANQFRRELLNLRRTIKYVVKSLYGVSKLPDHFTLSCDQDDYKDFEKGLKEFSL